VRVAPENSTRVGSTYCLPFWRKICCQVSSVSASTWRTNLLSASLAGAAGRPCSTRDGATAVWLSTTLGSTPKYIATSASTMVPRPMLRPPTGRPPPPRRSSTLLLSRLLSKRMKILSVMNRRGV
jgi:hypothetical protein